MNNFYYCLHCGTSITKGVHDFSTDVYGIPLCLTHQIKLQESQASREAKDIFLALKYNNIPAELEYNDGKKTIDVAIPGKLYIEMDCSSEHEAEQAMVELITAFKTPHKEKIPTVKIPNSLVNDHAMFKRAMDCLAEMCSGL